jgi:HSP20 family protein
MLMRFDPFRELDRLNQDVWASTRRPSSPVMPLDAYQQGDRFVVNFDLPGIDPSSIDLTVEKNVLTVRAERRWQVPDDVDVVVAERPQGSFSRQLFLGETLDTERIAAGYDQGVLSVSIPVAEAAKPRRVEIGNSGGGKATAITAEAS